LPSRKFQKGAFEDFGRGSGLGQPKQRSGPVGHAALVRAAEAGFGPRPHGDCHCDYDPESGRETGGGYRSQADRRLFVGLCIAQQKDSIPHVVERGRDDDQGHLIHSEERNKMAATLRNVLCPCGSGKKYKKCCGAKSAPAELPGEMEGLGPAMRMKGGVRFDPYAGGYFAIVHSWDNIHCHGEPKEWRYPKAFATEDEAMRHYKTTIRPSLEKLMKDFKREKGGVSGWHRRLEE